MTSSSFCQLQTNSSIVDIREEGDHVYSRYRDAQGKTHNVKSRFLVGADGKTGFTRKNFLEPLGIHMEQAHQ
jgi:2-polyprenyl-6-methoxyphenol hydroxylase-like FAD-dependent oxidoreductase